MRLPAPVRPRRSTAALIVAFVAVLALYGWVHPLAARTTYVIDPAVRATQTVVPTPEVTVTHSRLGAPETSPAAVVTPTPTVTRTTVTRPVTPPVTPPPTPTASTTVTSPADPSATVPGAATTPVS